MYQSAIYLFQFSSPVCTDIRINLLSTLSEFLNPVLELHSLHNKTAAIMTSTRTSMDSHTARRGWNATNSGSLIWRDLCESRISKYWKREGTNSFTCHALTDVASPKPKVHMVSVRMRYKTPRLFVSLQILDECQEDVQKEWERRTVPTYK